MPDTLATTTHRYTDALSKLHGRASGPDDHSGGLDLLVDAAKLAAHLHLELDYLASGRRAAEADPDTLALLRRARDDAYDTWQQLERTGLPLLQRWQRETLGYSDQEISR